MQGNFPKLAPIKMYMYVVTSFDGLTFSGWQNFCDFSLTFTGILPMECILMEARFEDENFAGSIKFKLFKND